MQMAKTGAVFIFVTFIISGISLLFSVVALGTDQWVVGYVNLNANYVSSYNNYVKYGLFVGSYSRTVSTEIVYGLTITCDFGEGKCAMLCGDSSLRSQYLQSLFEGDERDGYRQCSGQTRSFVNNNIEDSQARADGDIPDGFINCGLWLTTVLFLIISCLFGVISTLLAILNTVSNPVETLLSIFGLFIYNCVACVFSLIVLILWGVQFALTLTDNVAIHDTIVPTGDSSGNAGLGFSYWFNLIACIGYASSCGILAFRQYLINKEPENIVNLEDNNDNTIILF